MLFSPGNAFSILVFFIWIPAAVFGARRWPAAKTGALLILLPVMFLPELVSLNLPGLPAFNKTDVAKLTLLVAVLLFHRERLRTIKLSRWVWLMVVVFLASKVITVFVNRDPITQGLYTLRTHTPYDAVTAVIEASIAYVVPFVLAAALFKDARDLRVLFRILVGATLVYAVLQLIEVRFSPRLHVWVYGFFPHDWSQVIRGGGFRPVVFMSHGIQVAMFTLMGLLAAAALQKSNVRVFRVKAIWATSFLWVVLFLNKSLAAFLYSIIAVPLILFFKPKTQFRAAMALGIIVLTYPALRAADFIPVQDITDFMAEQFEEERARSLMVRFTNEQDLLHRALERPLFGWGSYGRTAIYHPVHGRLLSIPDGEWIVTLGESGVIGFLGKYLLLLTPLFVAARRSRYLPRRADRRLLSALALMIGFSAFNMLPNSDAYSLPFLFTGALLSSSRSMVRDERRRRWQMRRQAEMRRLKPQAPRTPA